MLDFYLLRLKYHFFSRRANEVLKNETEMFEKFYVKVDPKDSTSTMTLTSVPSIPSQEVSISLLLFY